MNEIEAMKAEFAAAKAAAEAPKQNASKGIVAEEMEAAKKREAKPEVPEALPVMPTATAEISYRDPATGQVRSATVAMRVLLKTDERMLLNRVASRCLAMAWDAAPAVAQMQAWDQAMCRVQWDMDEEAPDWFKQAYVEDPALATALAQEVEALTEAYFRGHDEAGRVSEERRFLVKRT